MRSHLKKLLSLICLLGFAWAFDSEGSFDNLLLELEKGSKQDQSDLAELKSDEAMDHTLYELCTEKKQVSLNLLKEHTAVMMIEAKKVSDLSDKVKDLTNEDLEASTREKNRDDMAIVMESLDGYLHARNMYIESLKSFNKWTTRCMKILVVEKEIKNEYRSIDESVAEVHMLRVEEVQRRFDDLIYDSSETNNPQDAPEQPN